MLDEMPPGAYGVKLMQWASRLTIGGQPYNLSQLVSSPALTVSSGHLDDQCVGHSLRMIYSQFLVCAACRYWGAPTSSWLFVVSTGMRKKLKRVRAFDGTLNEVWTAGTGFVLYYLAGFFGAAAFGQETSGDILENNLGGNGKAQGALNIVFAGKQLLKCTEIWHCLSPICLLDCLESPKLGQRSRLTALLEAGKKLSNLQRSECAEVEIAIYNLCFARSSLERAAQLLCMLLCMSLLNSSQSGCLALLDALLRAHAGSMLAAYIALSLIPFEYACRHTLDSLIVQIFPKTNQVQYAQARQICEGLSLYAVSLSVALAVPGCSSTIITVSGHFLSPLAVAGRELPLGLALLVQK